MKKNIKNYLLLIISILILAGCNKPKEDKTTGSFEGKYNMKGQFYHPSLEPTFAHHNFAVELHSTSTNEVNLFWPLMGMYSVPRTNNGSPFLVYSGNEGLIVIDPSTNAATVFNAPPTAIIAYHPISSYNGNTYNNRWDPATKTFYVAFGYNLGAGGVIVPGSSIAWIDTLTYLGPR